VGLAAVASCVVSCSSALPRTNPVPAVSGGGAECESGDVVFERRAGLRRSTGRVASRCGSRSSRARRVMREGLAIPSGRLLRARIDRGCRPAGLTTPPTCRYQWVEDNTCVQRDRPEAAVAPRRHGNVWPIKGMSSDDDTRPERSRVSDTEARPGAGRPSPVLEHGARCPARYRLVGAANMQKTSSMTCSSDSGALRRYEERGSFAAG